MDSGQEILILGTNREGLRAALTLASLHHRVVLATSAREIEAPRPVADPEEARELRILALRAVFHPLIEIKTQTRLRPREKGPGLELVQDNPWVLPGACTACGRCLEACPVQAGPEGRPVFRLDNPSIMAMDKRRSAPCREACPLGMNPQGYIALIAAGRDREALDLIRETNPLPGICGRVCDHPCETVCRRGELDQAVAIRDLKRFAAEQGLEQPRKNKKAALKRPKIAIVGSGPAGLTAAHDLARAGFRPTIFEADSKPGGLLRQGIAPYRLPGDVLDREIQDILALGVELKLNSPVNTAAQVDGLKKRGFEAVILCLGAGRDRALGIPGEDLAGVLGCVSFLGSLWQGDEPPEPGRVVIIGGGNAAVEAARTSLRFGAQSVTILYRRTRAEMPADPHEIEQALEEGVKIRELAGPLAFEGRGGRLSAVLVQRMKLGPEDASGRRSPVPIPGAEERIGADTAIVSVGQGLDLSCVLMDDLPLDKRGAVSLDQAGTCLPGVYAAGDVVNGPSSVVRAMASGREAARRIILALGRGGETLPPLPVKDRGGADYEPLDQDLAAQERTGCATRDAAERIKDCGEVVGTYTPDQARQEAARCLQCGVCSECGQCVAACGLGVIDHSREPLRRAASFQRIILADPAQLPPGTEPQNLVRIPVFGRANTGAKADLAGRNAALAVCQGLERTKEPVIQRPVFPHALTGQEERTGLLLCSCNQTLNQGGRLDRLAAQLGPELGFAAVEVLVSACHPHEGRRVEGFIQEHGLSVLVLGSCVCCHLDFVCESCTDQRMRLKDRLFRQSGLAADRVALVNLRETCFSSPDLENGTALAQGLIKTGLLQLREQRALAERPLPGPSQEVIVVGSNRAGTAAALGLAQAGRPVSLVHKAGQDPEPSPELQQAGVAVLKMIRIIGLKGGRGGFRLVVETSPGREELPAGEIILAQGGLSRLKYQGPVKRTALSPGPRGSLETSIPGVYLASWPQARTVPPEELGRGAAGLALEREPKPFLAQSAQVDPELCRGCEECARVCPEGAARLVADGPGPEVSRVDPDLCLGCGLCLAVCPTGALSLPETGEEYYREVLSALLS